ncbi:MAG: S-layer homology domain-containing protein, partial [Oscillospiraceae bacterium]|nr:S-layer homology domain-containing protein [Oscillospiraceae bacterium]
LNGVYDEETALITFAVSHQSRYAVGYDPVALWVNVFGDISESAWYYDAVAYVSHYGLFVGNGGKFMPDDGMTRAMFVTVLWSLEGKPAPGGSASFGDVPVGTWYHDGVIWAAENGIVAGTGGGNYSPDKTISRQEMALMLLNYSNFKGYAIPDNREAPDYTDTAQIAVWAESAAKELSEAGVMGGNNNAFMPQKAACRAEAAQLIKNFLRLIAGGK